MIKLERFCYSDVGTFGKMEVGGKTYYVVEPPWRDNEPSKSCIPEGKYSLKRDMSGEFRGFQLQSVPGRTEIEMHPGNTHLDTAGCLCPGKSLGYVANLWAVVNSKAAMRELKDLIMKEKHASIQITNVFDEGDVGQGGE